MHVITRQTQAAGAAERWNQQYDVVRWKHYPDLLKIGNQLIALGDRPNPDLVDQIIGNTYWTAVPRCHNCNTGGHPFVIQVGKPKDTENAPACLCSTCIDKLAVLNWETLGKTRGEK